MSLRPNFDYAALPATTADAVKQHGTEIRTAIHDAAQQIVSVGKHLIAVKDALPHGMFGEWLRVEFEWSDDTAGRFMNVARKFGDIPHGADFDAKALYLLAARAVPEAARQEAIALAQAGGRITVQVAAEIAASHTEPPAEEEEEEDLQAALYRQDNEHLAGLAQIDNPIPVVDGMPINESHPVGYAGLYGGLDATGYGQATCAACKKTHNRWSPVRAGRWRCDRCGSTINDDLLPVIGKEENALADRLRKHKRPQRPAPPAPVSKPAPLAQHSSKSVEWYTPAKYLVAVRAVLGAIELDPASNSYANQIVRAEHFYTAQDNGLLKTWRARTVFLNPPYGKASDGESVAGLFVNKLIAEYSAGHVGEAILLVNAATYEQWYQPLWGFPICFTHHRIKFWTKDGQSSQPSHGNCFVYFGTRGEAFAEAFDPVIGIVVQRFHRGTL